MRDMSEDGLNFTSSSLSITMNRLRIGILSALILHDSIYVKASMLQVHRDLVRYIGIRMSIGIKCRLYAQTHRIAIFLDIYIMINPFTCRIDGELVNLLGISRIKSTGI